MSERSRKIEKMDRIVVKEGFLKFANEKWVGCSGEHTPSLRVRAAAFKALELVQQSGSWIELSSDHEYWLMGPLGNQRVSSPIGLAKCLGFLA